MVETTVEILNEANIRESRILETLDTGFRRMDGTAAHATLLQQKRGQGRL
jgi:hypothetical protein